MFARLIRFVKWRNDNYRLHILFLINFWLVLTCCTYYKYHSRSRRIFYTLQSHPWSLPSLYTCSLRSRNLSRWNLKTNTNRVNVLHINTTIPDVLVCYFYCADTVQSLISMKRVDAVDGVCTLHTRVTNHSLYALYILYIYF